MSQAAEQCHFMVPSLPLTLLVLPTVVEAMHPPFLGRRAHAGQASREG